MAFSKESAFDRLRQAHQAGRLAHAYLITGTSGSGKRWLAAELAAIMLGCKANDIAAHPDSHAVQPESKSRRIVIDQIRELEQAMHRKPLLGSTKVAIIHETDRLQPQAANAFLKTLEEPPAGSLILLLSSLPEAILETVLSRCVEIPLLGDATGESTPEEQALLRHLDDCLVRPAKPGVADAFRFTRAVQEILSGVRERIGDEYETSLKEDTAHYKQTSDSSKWLDERAEQIKALTEAAALRERERILQLISNGLCNALRAQHGQAPANPVARGLAEKFTSANLLHRIDTLESLRHRLAMGVQEALALESGFLEMIVDPV